MLDRTTTTLPIPATLPSPITEIGLPPKSPRYSASSLCKIERAAKTAISPSSAPTQSHISGNIGNKVSVALGKIEIAAKTARVLNSPTSKKGDRVNIGNIGNIGNTDDAPCPSCRRDRNPRQESRQNRQRHSATLAPQTTLPAISAMHLAPLTAKPGTTAKTATLVGASRSTMDTPAKSAMRLTL